MAAERDYVDIFDNGGAAVDLYRYHQGTAVPKPQELPEEQPAQEPKKRLRVKPGIAPFALIGALAAIFLLVMVIQANVRLYVVKNEIGEIKSENRELDGTISRLRSDYESKIDMHQIEVEAKALGMHKPSASQIVYLDIPGADSAEVLAPEERGAVGTLWDAIKDGVGSIGEYFR